MLSDVIWHQFASWVGYIGKIRFVVFDASSHPIRVYFLGTTMTVLVCKIPKKIIECSKPVNPYLGEPANSNQMFLRLVGCLGEILLGQLINCLKSLEVRAMLKPFFCETLKKAVSGKSRSIDKVRQD